MNTDSLKLLFTGLTQLEMVEAQGQVSERQAAKEGKKRQLLLTKAAKYGQRATARSRLGQNWIQCKFKHHNVNLALIPQAGGFY